MHIENISYDKMSLDRNGQSMLIQVYEKEIYRLNNIINECSDDILKELEENNHLSYGVALSIRNKLLDYKELKENKYI